MKKKVKKEEASFIAGGISAIIGAIGVMLAILGICGLCIVPVAVGGFGVLSIIVGFLIDFNSIFITVGLVLLITGFLIHRKHSKTCKV